MEEVEQSKIKICENCQKSFPQQKIDLHEAYCRKHIKKCNKCIQMYDINSKDDHDKQFHSIKECQYCNKNFPEKQWQNHQFGCKRRPLKCRFCQNNIAYEEIIKHEENCGSRTSQCQKCKQFISLRELQLHDLTCVQKIPLFQNRERQFQREQRRDFQYLQDNLVGVKNYHQRRPQQRILVYQNSRQYNQSFERPPNRNEKRSNKKMNTNSPDKQKKNYREKINANLNNIKPSHLIQPERERQMVDPVPISIRLAMSKSNPKLPLQNRN